MSRMNMLKAMPMLAALSVGLLGEVAPAHADLEVCNTGTRDILYRHMVADRSCTPCVGAGCNFSNQNGWWGQGWWTIAVGRCAVVYRGDARRDFLYHVGSTDGTLSLPRAGDRTNLARVPNAAHNRCEGNGRSDGPLRTLPHRAFRGGDSNARHEINLGPLFPEKPTLIIDDDE